MKGLGKRFLASTRGQVVDLLRRGEASVNDLAQRLELTDNAVRAHLSTLERDGLVRQAGKRAGLRKPEVLYALTPEAEQIYPKAYHVLLGELLSTLEDRLDQAGVDDLLEEVGRNLARGCVHESASRLERAHKAVEVLNGLGGLAELEEVGEVSVNQKPGEGPLAIQGYSCPLAAVAGNHPNICLLAQSLLQEIMGTPVREACNREGVPRCRFTLEATPTR